MSNIFITSDTHFWHKNICDYSNRPFSCAEEMNEIFIERWNKKISKYDIVYHLGDVSLGNEEKTLIILRRLNGNISLIKGNHDKIINKPEITRRFNFIKDRYNLKIGNQTIVLDHFPLLVWDKAHYGAWQFQGHSHGSLNKINKLTTRFDVGVDNSPDYTPFAWEELVKIMENKIYKPTDHHK